MSVDSQVRHDQNDADRFELQRTGLHDVVVSPAIQDAMHKAVAAYLGPIFEPDLLERLRRFVSKGDRNDARSFVVGVEPPASAGVPGRVRILERDPSRVQAIIYNLGAQTIYVGGRQVTTGVGGDPSGGIPIATNTGLVLDANIGELYAVSGTAGMDVRVLDVSGGV